MKEVKNYKNEMNSYVFETVLSDEKHVAIIVPTPGKIKLNKLMITARGLLIAGIFETNSQTCLSTSSTTATFCLKCSRTFSFALSNLFAEAELF